MAGYTRQHHYLKVGPTVISTELHILRVVGNESWFTHKILERIRIMLQDYIVVQVERSCSSLHQIHFAEDDLLAVCCQFKKNRCDFVLTRKKNSQACNNGGIYKEYCDFSYMLLITVSPVLKQISKDNLESIKAVGTTGFIKNHNMFYPEIKNRSVSIKRLDKNLKEPVICSNKSKEAEFANNNCRSEKCYTVNMTGEGIKSNKINTKVSENNHSSANKSLVTEDDRMAIGDNALSTTANMKAKLSNKQSSDEIAATTGNIKTGNKWRWKQSNIAKQCFEYDFRDEEDFSCVVKKIKRKSLSRCVKVERNHAVKKSKFTFEDLINSSDSRKIPLLDIAAVESFSNIMESDEEVEKTSSPFPKFASTLTIDEVRNIVQSFEKDIHQVFEGKANCRRHDAYKKGGRDRACLRMQTNNGFLTEEHEEVICHFLLEMFCARKSKYFDYIMKVLLPETITMFYAKVANVSIEELCMNQPRLETMRSLC